MEPQTTKTTKKQFELFKDECREWARRLELSQWELGVSMVELDEGTTAQISRNYLGKSLHAKINTTITKHTDNSYNDTIKTAAKHEMLHGLLAELAILGQSRYIQQDEIMQTEEALVRKLEKLIE